MAMVSMRLRSTRCMLVVAGSCWFLACARDPDPSKYMSGMLAGGSGGAPPAVAMSGAAGAPAASSGSGFPSAGGYISSGEWHGYAFTAASGSASMISPMDFDARQAGQPLCASGTVGAAADYSGTALVGVNVAQEMTTDSTPMAVVPMKRGVMVQVKNNAGSTLRLQIQGPNGGTDAKDRWCAPIVGNGGFIPFSQFNSACWDNSGSAYAMQPIVAAMVIVPGGNSEAVKFDFCIEALRSADAEAAPTSPQPAAGAAAAAPSTGTGTISPGNGSGSGMISDKYGAVMVQRDGRSYYVQNNVWGDSTSQTLAYNGTTFEVTNQTGMNFSSGPNAMGPVSYPSVFIGSNYNRATSGSNLPKQVSMLTSVKTGFSHNAGSSVAGSYNAAYDVWFSTNASGDAQAPSGGYLMVWYSKPAGIQPIGRADPTPVAISGVSGTWEVWLGQNGSRPCISYVRTEPSNALEFDLNAFIQDAVTRPNAIKPEWYLSNVFAGFEIWNGGVGLKTTAFYAIVQ
jgi:hypothetical protein